MEICYPPLLKPCYSMKANTLGKPTEMGFLYSHDQEANGVPLSPIQSSQSPMPKMPEIVPQKGLFSKSVDFRMRVFFKSNGVFTGLETPSTTPVFFPLKVAHGYYGTPENFYKYIDGMSYTVKSMVQLDSQQQASVILHTPIEKRSPVNDPHHHEFQPEDLREVISKGIEFKPQQVEPIVIGQKVGLKKW